MRTRGKCWGLVAAVVAILVIGFLLLRRQSPATAGAVKIAFAGYTNAPNSPRLFALFEVSNHASYDIRWWGDWVEVEGSSEQKARVVNFALPGVIGDPVLKAGDSFMIAVGVPFHPPETGQWRFAMSFSRYLAAERYLDFSRRHKWPLRLGPIVLVDDQRILNPTNHVTASSDWLAN